MSDVPLISLSVVSHGQIDLVRQLLDDLRLRCVENGPSFEVILTLNLPERISFRLDDYPYPIRLVTNPQPKGFGANHNAAFAMVRGEYYGVLNPDIRLTENPFPILLAALSEGRAGVVAPLVLNVAGQIEDSARRFPSPGTILRKAFGGVRGADYPIGEDVLQPEWVAGMFMLFPRCVFAELGGFDEGYFLYYEDVDLCARLAMAGYAVKFCPQTHVIHEARRTSHSSFKYMKWHLASMARFFTSAPYRAAMRRRNEG